MIDEVLWGQSTSFTEVDLPKPLANRLARDFPGITFLALKESDDLYHLWWRRDEWPNGWKGAICESPKDIDGNFVSGSHWDYIEDFLRHLIDGTPRTLTDRDSVSPVHRPGIVR